MADKSVAQKLLIKENHRVLLINEPSGYRDILGETPPNVTVLTDPSGPADVVQVFVSSREELDDRLPPAKPLVKPGGLLWVTYPKGSPKARADVNRDTIREYARTIGLEGIAMISVDDTWSALRVKSI